MTIGLPFQSEEYKRLNNDFRVICIAKTEYGDRFAVVDKTLEVTAGGIFQGLYRTCNNSIYGGYNRNEVADYLDSLAHRSISFLKTLQNPSIEELVKYRDRLRTAVKKLKLLNQNAYRKDHEIQGRVETVYKEFFKQIELINSVIKKYSIQGSLIPPEPIDFDESIPSRLTDWRIPSSATIDDVLRLAKSAETNRGYGEAQRLDVVMHTYAIWFLNGSLEDGKPSYHLVTKAHTAAFSSLAHHFNSELLLNQGPILDEYFVISSDPGELIQLTMYRIKEVFQPEFNPLWLGSTAKELIKEWIASAPNGYVTLHEFTMYFIQNDYQLLWVEQPKWFSSGELSANITDWIKAFSGTTLEDRKQYFRNSEIRLPIQRTELQQTYITWPLLLEVIDALKSNPRWTHFYCPNGSSFLQLHEQMELHGFIRNPKNRCAYIRQFSL